MFLFRHIARPAVTEVPVVVVDELEVREGEVLFEEVGELGLDGLGPLTHQHNELINVPCHTTTGNLRVVTLEQTDGSSATYFETARMKVASDMSIEVMVNHILVAELKKALRASDLRTSTYITSFCWR